MTLQQVHWSATASASVFQYCCISFSVYTGLLLYLHPSSTSVCFFSTVHRWRMWTLRWNVPRVPQQHEDHYEANSWLSMEPLSWPRPLSGIPAAMNHGEQPAIGIAGCGLTCLLWRQNATPVILGVKPSLDLSFCMFWCEISCSGVRFKKK